ncbi:hypothetical protein HanPSC8_Chr04g0137511 [Helianthus annuus]|nr:hypothetical protein HanPSC8_Chr04g0137511 [Helianthus annuus]
MVHVHFKSHPSKTIRALMSFKRHQLPELLPRFVPNKRHITTLDTTIRRGDRQIVIHSSHHLTLSFNNFHKLKRHMLLLVVLIDRELADVHDCSVGDIGYGLPTARECPFA